MSNGKQATRSALKRSVCALALGTIALPLAAGPAAATTTTEAQKLATAGMLNSADLPGWTELGSGLLGGTAAAGLKCSGVKAIKMLAGSRSQFESGSSVVISGSSVAASAGAAKSDFNNLKSAHVQSCIKNGLLAGLKSDGVTAVSLKRVTAKVSGADDSVGFRVTLTGKMHGVGVTIDDYLVQERVGQAEITVLSQKVNSGFPSLTKTIGYAKTLAHRVRAA